MVMAHHMSLSSNATLDFSDAEIKSELSRLGYDAIDPQQFEEFKKDLIDLVQAERSSSFASQTSNAVHQQQTRPTYDGRYDQLYRSPYEQEKENLDSVSRPYVSARERLPLSNSNSDYRTATQHSPNKPTVAWSKRKSQIHAGRYYDNIEEGARSLPISKHRTMSEYYRPLGDDFERPRSADGVRRYSGGGGYSRDVSGDDSRVRHLDDYWYDQHQRSAGDEETYTSDTTARDHRRLYADDYTTTSDLAEQSRHDTTAPGESVTDTFHDKLNLSKASQSSSIVKRKVSRKMRDGTSQVYEESYVQDSDTDNCSDAGSLDAYEDRLHPSKKTGARGNTAYINNTDTENSRLGQGSRQERIAARTRGASARYDKTIDPVKTAVIWPEPKQPVSKMKTDPVNRYQQYQQQWNKSKVPEEKTHKNLRWSIREQMLYKDVIYEKPQKKYVENKYVVPTDKPRKDLRWRVRCDMAAGILPSNT